MRVCWLFAVALGWGASLPAVGTEGSPAGASRHWAFVPAVRPVPPPVSRLEWPRNPIDHFVLARLEQEGIAPAPEADRRTLVRRLSLDLLGLPPSVEEVREFIEDTEPGAYERLVDRLLASPHFGERWGRHWLDLARYADSDGYEKDGVRPYAWTYRDWVVEAINQDLPFDRFSLEQLAGDLLPAPTQDQRIATGFHRNTLTNREGGVDAEEFRTKAVVDRASTTGTVWLGLTLACAECHDHKYDPITQREFFQMYAFFNSAVEQDIPAPRPEELAEYQRRLEPWEEEAERLARELARLVSGESAEGLRARPGLLPENIQALARRPEARWTDEERRILAEFYAAEPDPRVREHYQEMVRHEQERPRFPETLAQTLAESDDPPRTQIHLRGDFLSKGAEVEPGTLSVLHPFRPAPGNSGLPNRLDLAHWLFEPDNPLTGRVTVNRIWGRLFGRPLVRTDEDFGRRGEGPSHPELLDWLALEFPRLGWSRKALIKGIVNSATYRQRSVYRPELGRLDPQNVLLARQNRFRVEAEVIRDAHLAVSGLLDRRLGGPGVRPPLPADIAALGYANSVRWAESGGSDRYRRGLYIFFQRTVPYPMLATFDAPDSNVSCTRRERSNTPIQALTLWNDPVFFECAQALGRSVALGVSGSVRERLGWLFETGLARPPDGEEMERLERLHAAQLRLLEANPDGAALIAGGEGTEMGSVIETAAWVLAARTVLNLDEFISRE